MRSCRFVFLAYIICVITIVVCNMIQVINEKERIDYNKIFGGEHAEGG